MGTSGKAFRSETSSFSSLVKMLHTVAFFVLLGNFAHSLPVAEPDAEADPQLLAPVVATYGAPLVYHSANCTTAEDTITIKKCTPKTENNCEDVEVPSQKLEYVAKCQNVTTTHCTNGLTTIKAEGTKKKKRDADADADADPEANPLLYSIGVAPVVPLLKHTCVDTVQEHCIQEPVITDTTTTVSRCLVKTSVECEDVEHKIPKTVCTQEPLTYIG